MFKFCYNLNRKVQFKHLVGVLICFCNQNGLCRQLFKLLFAANKIAKNLELENKVEKENLIFRDSLIPSYNSY